MAGLDRVCTHDLSGKSSLSRDMDKITKPSMQRNGEINGSRETSRGKCLREQGDQHG